MSKLVGWLIAALITASVLSLAGPTLVGLANAALPLVIAIGLVVALLRIVWHLTRHY